MLRLLPLLALFALLAPTHSRAEGPAPPVVKAQDPDLCADARASARYVGYGYTHVVTLVNGCARKVECVLWTDVDPEPKNVLLVAPGERAEVVTRRGSPSRAVTALKRCSFR